MSSNLCLLSKTILRKRSYFQSFPSSSIIHNLVLKNCCSRISFSTQTVDATNPLTKEKAEEFVRKLSPEEREHLLQSVYHVTSDETKAGFKDQLAAYRWRSEFGRPSRLAQLGDVDPTGSYCPLPEDWLLQKYTETVAQPTRNELLRVSLINAIPFIGFGFLDNFFMITFGDTIEAGLSGFVVITTMTAAALGNTISDILGIGSAWYVEQGVNKLGFRPPKLLPIQMDMKVTRRAANWARLVLMGHVVLSPSIQQLCKPYIFALCETSAALGEGRTVGVTIGCLLGMSPLLFLPPKTENEPSTETDDLALV